MGNCSLTNSEESLNWPEGVVSVKLTMNPYLLVLAEEKAAARGLKLWEYINLALWKEIGNPTKTELMDFAASFELDEMDPKWKHRLKLAARHEVETGQIIKDSEGDCTNESEEPNRDKNKNA